MESEQAHYYESSDGESYEKKNENAQLAIAKEFSSGREWVDKYFDKHPQFYSKSKLHDVKTPEDKLVGYSQVEQKLVSGIIENAIADNDWRREKYARKLERLLKSQEQLLSSYAELLEYPNLKVVIDEVYPELKQKYELAAINFKKSNEKSSSF